MASLRAAAKQRLDKQTFVWVAAAMDTRPLPHYERLSAQDASFIAFESDRTPMHVGGLSIYELGGNMRATADRGVDFERIRAAILSRLPFVPRYRQRLMHVPLDGAPIWVDDADFDIDRHVRRMTLPGAGDERELRERVGFLLEEPLDPERPLWEIWVIDGLQGGRFAMLNKIHHSMVDGSSGVDLMYLLLSPSPDAAIEEPPAWVPRPAPSRLRLVADELARRARLPFEFARGVANALADPRRLVNDAAETMAAIADTLRAGVPGAPPTPLNGRVGRGRRIDWRSFDLARVKAVKNALGGTVNDVALAVTAGAVRAELRRREADPDALAFRAVVPVSMRSAEERGKLGNHVSAWIMPLPVDEPNARRRLERVRESTDDLKASNQALGAEALSKLGDWLGFRALSLALSLTNVIRPYNLIVTNVRGPELPFYFFGAKMVACYPALPLFEHQGLGIALFSYAGQLHWGLVGDRDRVGDLGSFARAIERSFRELERMAGTAPKRRLRLTRRSAAASPQGGEAEMVAREA
jgi:diacylglycerol O-acyltransferase / wax synthase